jgi:PadR family transcriptional regulator, regulatory protein AphA
MCPMVRIPLTTELALLGFLSEQPMHGYEIHQRMSDPQGLGQVWQLKQSQLYALLTKLKDDGNLAEEIQYQDSRPPRKLFHLTEQGIQTFRDWVESPVPHGREMRLDFLVKIYFARLSGTERVINLIEKQRAVCREWLTYQHDAKPGLSGPTEYEWFVRKFRAHQIQAMLDWLEEILAGLQAASPAE